MKTPGTKQEFYELIQSMELRERFCFKLQDQTDGNYCLEIYAGNYPGARIGDDDITVIFQTVDAAGKFSKGVNNKQSVIRRRISLSNPLFLLAWELIAKSS